MIEPDSRASWMRLLVLVVIATIGAAGMWSVVVTLPAVQAEFGPRGATSLPYTLTMVGVALGSILMGRGADRFGIRRLSAPARPPSDSAISGQPSPTPFGNTRSSYGLLIDMLGTAAVFGPLITEASHWFVRRRGLAVSICASGSYIAGAFWPGVTEHFVLTSGWRLSGGVQRVPQDCIVGLELLDQRLLDCYSGGQSINGG